MKSVVKIPLEVTVEQAGILDSQSKIANWLYNQLLEQATTLRKQYREAKAKGDQERASQIGLTLYTERGLRNLIASAESTASLSQSGLLLGPQERRSAALQSDQGLPGL